MSGVGEEKNSEKPSEEGFFQQIIVETFTSPINILLLAMCCVLIYKIYSLSKGDQSEPKPDSTPAFPKLKKQDMTLKQLRQYDGTGEHGRVCVAVNGKIFDMTRGSNFYGPGGPYSAFAGHDATHALGTFDMKDIKNESSDLSDLTQAQMESVREWEMQFIEKYDFIGRLIKEGEQPTEYSDDEESKQTSEVNTPAESLKPEIKKKQ